MEWIEIKKQPPDEDRVHYLTDGKTVFAVRRKVNPFFIQFYAEYTTIANFVPTHWTTLPDLPKEL